jgi:oligopeptide/dipeptide ABC transporter ATP-binding protein
MSARPLLEIRDLSKTFHLRRGRLFGDRQTVAAVRGVSFDLEAGTTLGVVGESGSGKSTMARCVLRLIEPDSGSVHFRGTDLRALPPAEMRRVRRHLALIFQNPYSSLDPTWTVDRIVGEAMTVQSIGNAEAVRAKVESVLERVGLPGSALHRRPRDFSGGQRQRIAIARALVTDPDFVVCDEAVSSLDVSTRSQVLELLHDLQSSMGLTYLFISHDLSVVRSVSDRVAVMYLGEIVEIGASDDVLAQPLHPYTVALSAAVPKIDRSRLGRIQRERGLLQGEPPSPVSIPSGCAFHVRCPIAEPDCATQRPTLVDVGRGRSVACHVVAPGTGGASPVPVALTHQEEAP